jgi:hypothetical protein
MVCTSHITPADLFSASNGEPRIHSPSPLLLMAECISQHPSTLCLPSQAWNGFRKHRPGDEHGPGPLLPKTQAAPRPFGDPDQRGAACDAHAHMLRTGLLLFSSTTPPSTRPKQAVARRTAALGKLGMKRTPQDGMGRLGLRRIRSTDRRRNFYSLHVEQQDAV